VRSQEPVLWKDWWNYRPPAILHGCFHLSRLWHQAKYRVSWCSLGSWPPVVMRTEPAEPNCRTRVVHTMDESRRTEPGVWWILIEVSCCYSEGTEDREWAVEENASPLTRKGCAAMDSFSPQLDLQTCRAAAVCLRTLGSPSPNAAHFCTSGCLQATFLLNLGFCYVYKTDLVITDSPLEIGSLGMKRTTPKKDLISTPQNV
jgi:hypothetical protein